MLLRRRASGSASSFYRGVPVVNLLTMEHKQPMRVFGAQGWAILTRMGLVVLMLAGAGGLVFATQETARYEDLTDTASRRAATANAAIDEALALQEEIDVLESSGNFSQRDFDFLKGTPAALIAAIQSVISLEVTGVELVSIETSPPDGLDVQIRAATHLAALEWRRLIGSAPGVGRVVSFDPSPDEPLAYNVQLVSEGDR